MTHVTIPGEKLPTPLADIVYLKGNGVYAWFYLRDGRRKLSSLTLGYYAELLPRFIRIHKSYVVNPAYVTDYERPTKKLPAEVTLSQGTRLPVSFRRWEDVHPQLSQCPRLTTAICIP